MAKGKKKKKKGSWLANKSRSAGGAAQVTPGKVVTATGKTFDQLVLKSDVPVLVDFWADWCAPCKAMAPTIEELAEQYSGLARVVKLNVEKHQKIAEAYDVRSIPTLMMFRDGEVLQTFIGAASKGELSKVISWALREE